MCMQFSSVMSDSLWPHGLQHTRLPCLSPTAGACSNSCSSNWWCHPTISSSVVPLSSRLQSFPASGSSPMSQLFAWGGQSIGVAASTSVFPMNTQDWSPLGWTFWISLPSKGLSRVFSNTTVQNHQFFGAHFLYSPTLTSIHDYWMQWQTTSVFLSWEHHELNKMLIAIVFCVQFTSPFLGITLLFLALFTCQNNVL